MATPAPRPGATWTRRGFLSGRQTLRVRVGLVTAAVYADWVRDYRSGRFIETARKVSERAAEELRDAQRGYLRSLPARDDPRGFRARVAAAALQAEAIASFGWNQSSDIRLLREPCDSLPDRWIAGLPPSIRADAGVAWGVRATYDPRRVMLREVALAAARPRFAILALPDASRVLDQASGNDPAILWQATAVRAFQARYLRARRQWDDVRDMLSPGAEEEFIPEAAGRASPRIVARAMSDPDDRNLRLALVALGMNRRSLAEEHLSAVRAEPWEPLRAPRRLLEGEALMKRSQFASAAEAFRAARTSAPTSQPAAAALAAALQAAGRWEEAGELARDWLQGETASRITPSEHPWLAFLTTWAVADASEFTWLRNLVRA